MQAQLSNGLSRKVGYNICQGYLTLERHTDEGWEEVPVGLGPTEDYACPAILYELASGESAGTIAYLPEGLKGGTYRLVTDVEVGFDPGEQRTLVTNAFEVTSGVLY